tara:strand:- start:15986 stop:17242 length:1257 start_codon:yes stop_codon:yes gene_type:complete
MKILLKTATVLEGSSPFHTKTVDILIEDGKIKDISDKINSSTELIISRKNLHVSLGWFDSSVCFGEPGLEIRETIENGLKTASHSGFTDICLQPNTLPKIDNNSILSSLKRHAYQYPCEIHPIACFSIEGKGENMTEYFDLHKGGAVAFGDFLTPIKNPNLLKSALLYVQSFDGLIMSTPRDPYINLNGIVNEGIKSTELGLLSIPSIAETTQIQRDLSILEYTGGKLHIPHISSLESVEIIRRAKKNGLKVTASVPIANLIFNDNVLDGFNSNYKLFPPIRNKEDQKILKEAVLDGTIDIVTSHHQPINPELKQVDFNSAEYGTISLETMFGLLNKIFPIEKVIDILTKGRSIFNMQNPKIEIGANACLTFFDPSKRDKFTLDKIISTSKNCAFIDMEIIGKVYGCINKNKIYNLQN